MGKGILIIVLGVSAILTLLMVSLNANSTRSLDTTIEFYEATQARLIANSGVEIYLEKLRRNKNLTGSFNDNPLLNGSFDIHISGPDPALIITSTATFAGKTHTSIVNAKRSPVTIPDVNSAIYISSENVGLNFGGNMQINGNDHFMDGTPSLGTPLPGIAVDNSTDSAFVVNDLKNKITSQILGSGGAPSVSTVVDNNDWLDLTENFIFAADITLPSGTYTTGTVMGTAAEPKITYASGNTHFSGSANGYGILIVNGNMTLSGNFTFRGIIIAYGQSSIETNTVGNAGIYGAAIFVGQNVNIQATGNSLFYYSKQAVQNAQDNLKSSRFEIEHWWE